MNLELLLPVDVLNFVLPKDTVQHTDSGLLLWLLTAYDADLLCLQTSEIRPTNLLHHEAW